MNARPRIGIDLGGTKTEIAVLDPRGEVVHRSRTATPPEFDGTVRTIAELVRDADQRFGRGTVGVGIPGSRSPVDGRIRNANSTWLQGHDLRGAIAEAIGRDVRMENDANCFALSEAADGAGAGAASVFGVILGTGVGGGIVIGGRLHSGATGIAGEWGHVPLPPSAPEEVPGPACWCGRHGCVERWLSGPALAADHERVTGRALDGHAIVSAAGNGDPEAAATLARWRGRLGRALGMIVNVLDPEVIVLGGGLSNLPGVAEGALAELRPHVFTDEVRTRVVRAVHGDSSGVFGAARLWDAGDGPDAPTDTR